MRALMARLPQESFVYLGDTARLPYGTKSADTVHALCGAGGDGAGQRAASSCWSSPATRRRRGAAARCEEAFAPLPVIDVIAPGAEAALAAAPSGPIAVIATEGTVKGGAYRPRHPRARARRPGGAAGLPAVRAAGRRRIDRGRDRRRSSSHRYLDPLLATDAAAALVLGCTHYPALKATIAQHRGHGHRAGRQRRDDGATRSRRCLRERRSAARAASAAPHRFLATDAPDRFARVGEIFLGRPIDPGQRRADRPSVIHAHQIQPVGRRDGAACGAVAALRARAP